MARMSSSESGTSTRRSISVEELSEDGVNFELTFSGPSPENLERGPQGRPYGNRFHSSAEVQHQAIQNPQDHQIRRVHEHPRAIIPSYHRRMNMRVVVDLEALFPDGAYDYHTGQLVDNLDNIHILLFPRIPKCRTSMWTTSKVLFKNSAGSALEAPFEKGTSNFGCRSSLLYSHVFLMVVLKPCTMTASGLKS